MSKKIVALILLLPLVLMMTLFTAVSTVSLSVNIPVEKIKILGDKFVSLDMDKQERYYLDYVIYPTVAVNKKVDVTVEKVGSQQLAQVEYKNGYIYPKQAGVANVCVTTADGGFRDAFQLVVKETKLKGISCSTDKSWLNVGETIQIDTQFIPTTAINKTVGYYSTDTDVLTVDDDGLIMAKAKGTASVIIRSLADPTIQDSLEFIVKTQELFSLPITETNTSADDGAVNMTVETDQAFSLEFGVYDSQGNVLDGVIEAVNSEQFVDLGNGNYRFDYKFIDESFYGTAVIKFTLTIQGHTTHRTFTITRVEGLDAQFKNQDDIFYAEVGKTFNWKNQIIISPSDTSVEYSVSYSNDNLAINSISYLAKANKMGVTTATITITNTKNPTQTVTLEKEVYIYPEEIYIEKALLGDAKIEEIVTIGKYNVKGEQVSHNLTLSFGGDVEGAGFDKIKQSIVFETSASKVKIENQSIKILDDNFNGIVDITAYIDVNGVKRSSQPYSVRCIGSGVEVDNFIDLHWATKNKKIVVLTNDIVDDFGKDAQGNKFYQGENIDRLESTYDIKYHQNVGNKNTQIITLLQFKADLYGNGHVISADNVTNVTNADRFNGNALFNGPLNLVAMSESGSSMVSVKAQDNVCFAVFENTTINNVKLTGCNLGSRGNTYDLTDLDYVGTVVEVFGDNVNIEYSRINNGRTVLRAFGDAYDASKTINVNVKNCVLSSAREFIVRLGSNLIVRDTNALTNAEKYKAPYLDDNYDLEFPMQEEYSSYSDNEMREYEQKYIKTFVNIENSVLKDSGIFCVGMDAHFAGPMLVDAVKVFPSFSGMLNGWKDISGTSYGAKLTFMGDVRVYDWKKINSIDSSTLIENKMDDVYPYNMLKLNVKEMVEKLDNTTMVIHDGNEQYVHGGIVFFGGGKNYCVFINNGQSFTGLLPQGTTAEFNNYKISLKDVGKEFLEKAAGDNPFYFMLYDANSIFTPQVQQKILEGGNAYNCIYFND